VLEHLIEHPKSNVLELQRVLRYLKRSPSRSLFFPTTSDLQLLGFSDADWVGCVDAHRSISGYCFFIGKSWVSWKSKKQPTVSCSSVEAIGRIYFLHIRRLPFQRKSTRFISSTFVGYHFKGNQQDLFSAHSSVTISKVINKIYFHAYSSVTISKVIGKIYFHAHSSVTISKVMDMIYFLHIRRLLFQR